MLPVKDEGLGVGSPALLAQCTFLTNRILRHWKTEQRFQENQHLQMR